MSTNRAIATFAVAAVMLLTFASASNAAPSGPSVSSLFGSRVTANPRFKAPYLAADFEGTGAPDSVYLVSIAAASPSRTLAPGVSMVNAFGSDPLGTHAEKLALAIVNAKSGRKFLLTGYEGEAISGYFDSPIWGATPVPLSVAKRGSKQFADFQNQEKRIKNDVLVVGTEAGVDTALYWNGSTYVLFAPDEE